MSCSSESPIDKSDSWPGLRGSGNGYYSGPELPLSWSDSTNISCSIDLPGYGQSSPVIWNDLVFVTSAEGKMKDTLNVLCVNVTDGKTIWAKRFDATQKVEASRMVSQGAPTPVVDEAGLYVFFESGNIIALTHEGEERWSRSLTEEYGEFSGSHGVGSSLAQTDNAIFVLIAHEGPSYLLSISKQTGKNIWKTDLPEKVSWTTPVVADYNGRKEIVVSSNGTVETYDVATGEKIWFVTGLERNIVPSPTVSDSFIIVGSSSKGWNLSVTRGGSGDVTEPHIRWKSDVPPSTFGSPVIVDNNVYIVSKAGVLSNVDLLSGETNWSQRIEESTWASPIIDGNRAYFFGKDGKTTVIRPAADSLQVLSVNTIATESNLYGTAAVNGALYLRTGKKLKKVSLPDNRSAVL
ncbi:MAG: PQQ-binding-like beta-propeller repeat protein [Calditrichota bacterium]